MLARRDPFREMMTLRSAIDRLFDSTFMTPQGWPEQGTWDMAMDVTENDDAYTVKASIPGVDPDDLEITYQGNTLTIKGEVKEEKDVEEEHYHLRERRFGTFSRSLSLPSSVKGEAIDAEYNNGVLTLRLPKVEEAKPKRISVQSSEPKKIQAEVSKK